jgi:hypothetical protein
MVLFLELPKFMMKKDKPYVQDLLSVDLVAEEAAVALKLAQLLLKALL